MALTIQLQNSVNYASIFTRLNPLANVGSITNEPALSIGNYVRQMILGPPFSWRWNRYQTAFFATIGVQDYVLVNWQATTAFALGRIYIDPGGNQQTITVAGTTGGSAPTWNETPGGFTTDGSITWVNSGVISGGAGPLLPFGWLEKAVAVDANANSYELAVELNMGKNTVQNQPFLISPISENPANGAVGFRIQPPPDQAYTVYMTYQGAAGNFAGLSDLWTPIPDYMSYIYNQGFLAKSYEYLSDERYGLATKLFLGSLLSANTGISETQVNIFLAERLNSSRETQSELGNAQLGRAGRAL